MSNPIHIPYGKGHIECTIPYDGLLTSRIDTLKSERPGIEIVEEAVHNPIGSKRLSELAKGKKTRHPKKTSNRFIVERRKK